MSDHLPECLRIEYMVSRHGYTLTASSDRCICAPLRACEQRVREEIDREAFLLDEGDPFRQVYRKGLDAAREAVVRLASDMANWNSAETADATTAFADLSADQWIWAQRGVHRALAAIDALREERP